MNNLGPMKSKVQTKLSGLSSIATASSQSPTFSKSSFQYFFFVIHLLRSFLLSFFPPVLLCLPSLCFYFLSFFLSYISPEPSSLLILLSSSSPSLSFPSTSSLPHSSPSISSPLFSSPFTSSHPLFFPSTSSHRLSSPYTSSSPVSPPSTSTSNHPTYYLPPPSFLIYSFFYFLLPSSFISTLFPFSTSSNPPSYPLSSLPYSPFLLPLTLLPILFLLLHIFLIPLFYFL